MMISLRIEMAQQHESGGCGCFALALLALAAVWWTHGKSPEAKEKAEQAAVTGTAPAPGVIEGAVAKVDPVRPDFDEDRAADAARSSLTGETYETAVGAADCTDDCEGHNAGWRWAADGNECGGGSTSFDEGCEAFATTTQSRVEIARRAYEAGDDTFAGEGE